MIIMVIVITMVNNKNITAVAVTLEVTVQFLYQTQHGCFKISTLLFAFVPLTEFFSPCVLFFFFFYLSLIIIFSLYQFFI